jgi:hypothetical protein
MPAPAGATAGPPADEPVAAERRYNGRRAPRDSHRGDRADADPDTVSADGEGTDSLAASNE